VTDQYAHLNNGSGSVRDHTATWDRLRPIGDAVEAQDAIASFCERKRITFASLEALGTRVRRDHDVGYRLAWGGSNGNGQITAIKYRPLSGTSHDCVSEKPSRWVRPIIIGKLDSLDWVIAEGETDAARLHDLVGDTTAILVLPTGATTFEPEWAAVIPRGAHVALCHDHDEAGDAGAAKAADIIGGRTVRVRPPIEGQDWCDWDGGREEFLALAKPVSVMTIVTAEQFAAVDEPGAEPIVGQGDQVLIAVNSDVMFYGDGGAAKTTLTVDLGCHMAAAREWLGYPISRTVNVLVVENEGPRAMFRVKVRRKLAGWDGPALDGRVKVQEAPWAQFTFATAEWRAGLTQGIKEMEIDVLIIGPLSRIGMNAAGTLQEVTAFMAYVGDVRAQVGRPLTVIIVHHENKGGSVSGAWEGAGDTLFHCEKRGNGFTDVHIQKARHASESHDTTLHLAWTDGDGFRLKDEHDRDLYEAVLKILVSRPLTVKDMKVPLAAGEDAIKAVIRDHPASFIKVPKEQNKALERNANAQLYRLAEATLSLSTNPEQV
jgi:hypothetical protein